MIILDKLVQDPVGFVRSDPLGQAVLAPFAVALVLGLLLRLVGGGTVGRRIAATGVAAGFLVAFVLMLGVPAEIPPTGAAARIFWIAGIGLALGFVLDAVGWSRAGGHALAFLVPAASLLWLVGGNYETQWHAALLLFAASILVYWRVAVAGRGSEEPEQRSAALFPPLLLLVSIAALARLTWTDGSGLALLAVALGAGTAGYLVLAYFFNLAGARPLRFETAGIFGTVGAAFALTYVALIGGGKLDPAAVAILFLVFVADLRAREIAMAVVPGGGFLARAVQPLIYAIVIAIPAVASIVYSIYVPLHLF